MNLGSAASLAWPHPLAALRSQVRRWWQARLPSADTLLLGQRNIYIVPTAAGLMFAATLVVLLLASINYQLNLGYVLTFLLAGSGAVSMHVTHGTLRGLTLRLRAPAPVFAGESALLEAVLTSPDGARFGIGLKLADAQAATRTWIDVPAQGQASAQIGFVPATRGLHALPALSIETRFPLGLFRAWAIWRPASQLLVYPAPERPAAPLPPARAVAGGLARSRSAEGGEMEGVRSYRRGDPLKLVYWKKAAKALASGGELVSRDTAGAVHQQLWLDWQACATLAPEERLSRLAAWVLAAQRAGAEYGLVLPGASIEPAEGEAQRRRCLEALALWR
ncbi:MAG: DUF58 domain-containing protein [Piscinibacter sp.]|uniref:DUF58 domain-containing protein n=1 Tax=Piscinibacter sp. TaxID=1903157 RepID=UPI001B3D734A|nr:DUF58 domain-containing protein [Piscinibacter sp.]MBP5991351.1 DUF58 domain-containing protein [Piscinibacter sp.]MBP6028499.1 DUF58 domain-containing protein [Piscinibacter sp.]